MDGINLLNQFLALHKPQLESSAVPQRYWKTLYHKLKNETLDSGRYFRLMYISYDEEDSVLETDQVTKDARPVFSLCLACEDGIRVNDENSIFLIDHCWTFRLNGARHQLETHEYLTDRLCAIAGIDVDDEDRVDKLLRGKLWKYCHAYTISGNGLTDEQSMPIWYVMDEVGSAMIHDDEPNFRVVPFLDVTTQTTYSLMFPIRDCVYNEPVTRDYLEYLDKDSPDREALMLPWYPKDFRHNSFVQVEPDVEYFSDGHIPETYPIEEDLHQLMPEVDRNRPLRVFAEYDIVRTFLNSPEFELVDDETTADVLWLTHHFKQFRELALETPNKFVNQFPLEYVLTIKDLLSVVCRRKMLSATEHHNSETLETYPRWLPTTYNLKTELVEFVSYYQHRADKGLDNHWIIKPFNLARGMDTYIADSLVQIVRLPLTGPKIAQKYVERPVLLERADIDATVKFDVRYVILLKSVNPLECYVYRKFFLRFANKSFSLDHFDDYEKHFTVMNYHDEAHLHHLKCEHFLINWQRQYPDYPWSRVEDDICHMLHEVFECAIQVPPPRGIACCNQSRALYAADIILEWNDDINGSGKKHIQPKLLEINWTPDCKRACQYYPEFFNDVFKLLFLDEKNDECFRLIDGNENGIQ